MHVHVHMHGYIPDACLPRASADIEILWKVVKGKWDCFAGSIFLYFVILNMTGLISQTLALCTALEGDRCTGVVYLFVLPVPIENMAAIIGDAAYATTLLLSLFLLCRELTTSRTLGKSPSQILHHAVPELVLCLIQWYGKTARILNRHQRETHILPPSAGSRFPSASRRKHWALIGSSSAFPRVLDGSDLCVPHLPSRRISGPSSAWSSVCWSAMLHSGS